MIDDPLNSENNQSNAIEEDRGRLICLFDDAFAPSFEPQLIIAYSGGVDSTLVAAAAQAWWNSSTRSKGSSPTERIETRIKPPLAVTANSPSVAQWQIDQALRGVTQIGIHHRFVEPSEIEDAAYQRNDSHRCFHCKTHLYSSIVDAFGEVGKTIICSGTNADDLGDHRPGIAAGDQLGVRKPLAELGIGKARVRQLAKSFELSCHDLPASPCLASRVVYGLPVDASRLALIEALEGQLRSAGFDPVRVRLRGQTDGISDTTLEVPEKDLPRLQDWILKNDIESRWWRDHRARMTIDWRGFRSGRLNAPEEQLHVIH